MLIYELISDNTFVLLVLIHQSLTFFFRTAVRDAILDHFSLLFDFTTLYFVLCIEFLEHDINSLGTIELFKLFLGCCGLFGKFNVETNSFFRRYDSRLLLNSLQNYFHTLLLVLDWLNEAFYLLDLLS